MSSHINDRSQIYRLELDLKNKNDARIIAYNFIETRSSVLDVGCSCGDFGILITKNKNCAVYGMEKDPESIRIARDSKTYKDLHEVDLNQFDEERFKNYYGFFDYIAFIDVLEHLINPDLVLLKMQKFLKTDGFFIISLPNISFGEIKINILNDDFTYTDTGILDRTHLKFFTYKTIIDLLTELNLEISESAVKVADSNSRLYKVPFYIERYIRDNPHSYVYNYISKVSRSNLGKDELRRLNTERIQVEWTSIEQELKLIRRLKWFEKFFPVGSRRRTYVKNIHMRVKGP